MALPGGPLNASSSQGYAIRFSSISPSVPFNVTPNGTVYLLPGQTLSFVQQPSYSLSVSVTDSNGLISSALLTVNVLEVDRPPTWVNGTTNWAMMLDDGATSGTVGNSGTGVDQTTGKVFVYSVSIGAIDPNPGHTLLYYANSWSPPQAAQYLYMDPLLGQIGVSATAPGNQFTYNPSWSWKVPFTVIANISAVDNTDSMYITSMVCVINSFVCLLQI
jgi:hypothetical protein